MLFCTLARLSNLLTIVRYFCKNIGKLMPQIFSKFLGYFSLKSSGQNSLFID